MSVSTDADDFYALRDTHEDETLNEDEWSSLSRVQLVVSIRMDLNLVFLKMDSQSRHFDISLECVLCRLLKWWIYIVFNGSQNHAEPNPETLVCVFHCLPWSRFDVFKRLMRKTKKKVSSWMNLWIWRGLELQNDEAVCDDEQINVHKK